MYIYFSISNSTECSSLLPAVEKYESLPSCKVNLMSHTWKQDRKKNQYLIIKCIFLIYVVTIATESCYLQKLDLDKVIWDLLMAAGSCTIWEAPVWGLGYAGKIYQEKLNTKWLHLNKLKSCGKALHMLVLHRSCSAVNQKGPKNSSGKNETPEYPEARYLFGFRYSQEKVAAKKLLFVVNKHCFLCSHCPNMSQSLKLGFWLWSMTYSVLLTLLDITVNLRP